MKDKRGQGISMEFIIIAALALIVLIVIVLFFTGALGKIFGQQKDIVGTATDQQKEMWTEACRLACTTGGQNPYYFCTHAFEVKGDKGEVTEAWFCNTASFKDTRTVKDGTIKDLGVACKEITTEKCTSLK